MAKNISLILHRFKDVRTSILILIFEDPPAFNVSADLKRSQFGRFRGEPLCLRVAGAHTHAPAATSEREQSQFANSVQGTNSPHT